MDCFYKLGLTGMSASKAVLVWVQLAVCTDEVHYGIINNSFKYFGDSTH